MHFIIIIIMLLFGANENEGHKLVNTPFNLSHILSDFSLSGLFISLESVLFVIRL